MWMKTTKHGNLSEVFVLNKQDSNLYFKSVFSRILSLSSEESTVSITLASGLTTPWTYLSARVKISETFRHGGTEMNTKRENFTKEGRHGRRSMEEFKYEVLG